MNGPGESELRAALDAERANAAELRRVARADRELLDALRRRRSVRLALAVDRRSERVRSKVSGSVSAARQQGRRLALALAALPNRRGRALARSALRDVPAVLAAPRADTRKKSVVVVTGTADPGMLDPQLLRCDELILVTDASRAAAFPDAAAIIERTSAEPISAAVSRAIDATHGDVICVTLATTVPLEALWLERLTDALSGTVGATCPTLVHPQRPATRATPHDLRVRALGYELELRADGTPLLRARNAGALVEPRDGRHEVTAASAACVLLDRVAYDRAGGLQPLPDLDAALIDLCLRMGQAGFTIVAVPSAVVTDGRPVGDRRRLRAAFPAHDPAWRDLVERHGAALTRSAAQLRDRQLRFAFTVAAPSPKVADRWGDWHLAQAFARALEAQGHPATVRTLDQSGALAARSADVHVVVRGLEPVRRTPGQRQVLWVISHPEAVEDDECDAADLILVASQRFATELRTRTSTPVEVFLQATDHERFRPRAPVAAHTHPVAVVAKTREVLRPVVADALAAGLRPAIYGSGWDRFVDNTLVVAPYVSNEDLPDVYSSVGVLLNDHWDTMRRWGFVSNRLFDALACGTAVISDDLPEIGEIFGDTVVTYRGSDDLRRQVETVLHDPERARERARRGRELVVRAHTFEHRARSLVELLQQHDLVGGE